MEMVTANIVEADHAAADANVAAPRAIGAAAGTAELPILDLGPYLAGAPGARDALVDELRHIQENIGFYVVVNHGVDRALIEAAYDGLKAFFALPLEDKLALRMDENSVGYVPFKSTVYVSSIINQNTKKDLNETLILARERAADHPAVLAGRRFTGPNKWPVAVVGFRDALVAYQRAIEALGRQVLPLYALALKKPSDFFDSCFTDPIMWQRNTYYPPVKGEDNQFGIAPHTDHSFLTLLPIADEPGLQILTQDGSWIEPPQGLDNGIVINTGEFFNRWTNNRFIATPHRVVPPQNDRYSITTFFNPDADTVAAAIDTCVGPNNPAKHDPVTLYEYVCWYIDTNYRRDAGGRQD